MIGAFARMFGTRERVLAVEETEGQGYQVKARSDEGIDTVATSADAPPEAFVERVPYEGGDVYFVPVLEALREWLRKGRTVSPTTENPQTRPHEEEGQ